jgi:hypothetical protein
MQSQTFGEVYGSWSPCDDNLTIPWAMDTTGEVYQYSLSSTGTCTALGTCTGGCWIDMGEDMKATDISSGDYLLRKADGNIYQWTQSTGCGSALCGSFAALAEQPPLPDAVVPLPDGGVEPVALLAIGAASDRSKGPLSAIDNTGQQANGAPIGGAVWANW